MNEEQRKMLSDVLDAMESLWLQCEAYTYILEHHQVPHWFDLAEDYRALDSSKALARKRFAPARALFQAAQQDSAALESLLTALGTKGKPN